MAFIKNHGRLNALIPHLEYLTMQCNFKDRKYHTELGCLYVDLMKREKAAKRDVESLRKKLVQFLMVSDLYSAKTIIHTIEASGTDVVFAREMALLKTK